MKKLIFAVILFILHFTVGATDVDTFSQGQKLMVTAHSGLKMRILPGTEHEHLKVIPYADEVQVIHIDRSQIIADRMDWTDGHWITVTHEGDIGYVFDGFLTALPLPRFDFEFVQYDMNLIYPLESWAAHHLVEANMADTLLMDNLSKVTQHFKNDHLLTRINTGSFYKTELTLSDVRIMDAYHLLEGMLTTKEELETFHKKSIFIESRTGHVNQIKIHLDNPVDIKLTDNGKVKITIRSTVYECSL